MLSVTSELGRFEELFSEAVYPVWPLWLAAALTLAWASAYFGYRRRWHLAALRHPVLSLVAAVFMIAIAAPTGYYLASPLFERSLACEASPLAGAGAGSDKCEDAAVFSSRTPSPSAPLASPELSATVAPTPGATFAARLAYQGEFHGADDFHYGRGKALLIETAPGQYVLRFEEFSVRNGPDLYVYLSTSSEGYEDGSLELGTLKATDGAFNYEVPSGTDISRFRSAVVWCKRFAVLFATAPLVPG